MQRAVGKGQGLPAFRGDLQAAQGAVIGWVLWFGALTAAALCTVLVAGYAAKHAAAIGVAAASLAMPCLALALLR